MLDSNSLGVPIPPLDAYRPLPKHGLDARALQCDAAHICSHTPPPSAARARSTCEAVSGHALWGVSRVPTITGLCSCQSCHAALVLFGPCLRAIFALSTNYPPLARFFFTFQTALEPRRERNSDVNNTNPAVTSAVLLDLRLSPIRRHPRPDMYQDIFVRDRWPGSLFQSCSRPRKSSESLCVLLCSSTRRDQ